jgi:uncharacterized protein (DUF2225 family)
MATLQQIRLTCPVCPAEFESRTLAGYTCLRKRTDFHEQPSGPQSALAYDVHTCTRCGFSANTARFEGAEVTEYVKHMVRSVLTPKLFHALSPADRWDAAAQIAEWSGEDGRVRGDLWLRAAWCAVEEQDTEAERYYRRKAVWAIEEALAAFDAIETEDRAVYAYLTGELWRRIGDLKQASLWFTRVQDELIDRTRQRWILEMAQTQRDFPREWL